MRKTAFILILAACLTAACTRGKMSSPQSAAEAYYEMLIAGEYDKFVAGIAYADSMTDNYRAQMVRLVAQHAEAQQQMHGGYASAQAVDDTISGDLAEVFLEISFADSTCEEVALPMIRCGKVWKMQ